MRYRKSKKIKLFNILFIYTLCFIFSLLLFIFLFQKNKIIGYRFMNFLNFNESIDFFEYQNQKLNDNIYSSCLSFFSKFFSNFSNFKIFIYSFGILILKTLSFILNLILDLCLFVLCASPFVLILYLFLKTKNNSYSYSKLALWYWKINIFIIKIFKNSFMFLKKYFIRYKKHLLISLLIILIFCGFVPRLIVELLIFIECYFKSLFSFNFVYFFLSIIFFNIYYIIKFLCFLPKPLLFLVLYMLFFLIARYSGEKKLQKLHNQRKKFVKYNTGQTTIINGAPGLGKTVNVVVNSLIAEENFIDDLEKDIDLFSISHPQLNLSLYRLKCSIDNKEIDVKSLSPKTRKIYYNFCNVLNSLDYSDLAESYGKLNYRQSFIASNFSILDPYFINKSKSEFTHKLLMESFKMYKPQKDLAFESYMVLAITEADKEWNSHDDKSEVSDEGQSASFGLISQATDRKVKIFMDYQCKDQLIKRIRANSETFIVLRSLSIKSTFLIKIFKIPFNLIYKFLIFLKKTYEGKKPYLSKNTNRRGLFEYKRNDYNLIYAIILKWSFIFDKIDNFFSRYMYMVHIGDIADNDDMKNCSQFKTYSNIRDLSFKGKDIFDSCMFGSVYDDLKEIVGSNKYLKDIPHWTSPSPSLNEFMSIGMNFYNKIFDAQSNKDNVESNINNNDSNKNNKIIDL